LKTPLETGDQARAPPNMFWSATTPSLHAMTESSHSIALLSPSKFIYVTDKKWKFLYVQVSVTINRPITEAKPGKLGYQPDRAGFCPVRDNISIAKQSKKIAVPSPVGTAYLSNILQNVPFVTMCLPWLFRPSRDYGEDIGYFECYTYPVPDGTSTFIIHKFGAKRESADL
jgi:hypothetical protein